MLNGQLKPGYNIQIGTENRYIVGFTIHPNPTDTKTRIPHLRHLKKNLGRLSENIVADAGYGSEENYEYYAGECKSQINQRLLVVPSISSSREREGKNRVRTIKSKNS